MGRAGVDEGWETVEGKADDGEDEEVQIWGRVLRSGAAGGLQTASRACHAAGPQIAIAQTKRKLYDNEVKQVWHRGAKDSMPSFDFRRLQIADEIKRNENQTQKGDDQKARGINEASRRSGGGEGFVETMRDVKTGKTIVTAKLTNTAAAGKKSLRARRVRGTTCLGPPADMRDAVDTASGSSASSSSEIALRDFGGENLCCGCLKRR
ncbi:hypothetical protein FH972_026145 [Carpinus fangiana]|uniref:Uncharacterized protein n=1 Tax=Carpinus fangiana TaxID=176857 RepID=A0A5N6L5Q2_9ROSI|nr:hypothetical protein FH972_026145 [Carpinus fangiana]